jgi:hypothetical protein
MDQAKRTNDASRDDSELQAPAPTSNEVRTLSELELVLCGGGEQSVNWPG